MSHLEDDSTICNDLHAAANELLQQKLSVFSDYDFTIPANRKPLAIDSVKEKILDTLHKENVVVVKGFTGCGKTTQVPQMILDECRKNKIPCNIVVTQPRRIAAMTLAKRVCEERNWALGTVVGYQVCLFFKSSFQVSFVIIFCPSFIPGGNEATSGRHDAGDVHDDGLPARVAGRQKVS